MRTPAMIAPKLHYHITWQQVDQALCAELAAFWRSENVLAPGPSSEQRAQQVLCIARDQAGAIAGICTAYKQLNQHIGHPFYYYRSLVRSDQRQYGIAGQLVLQAWSHLDGLSVNGQLDGCIGLCVIVENQQLIQHKREAVWPLSGLIYIGENSQGRPVRIRYFNKARI